jgi:glycosyltransferase involved in cell wall biosynthesis
MDSPERRKDDLAKVFKSLYSQQPDCKVVLGGCGLGMGTGPRKLVRRLKGNDRTRHSGSVPKQDFACNAILKA